CGSMAVAITLVPLRIYNTFLHNLSQMTVGGYHSPHDDHSRAVDSLCDRSSFCVDIPSDLGNGSVVNENLPRFENWFRGVQRDDGCVFEKDGHERFTSEAQSSPRVCSKLYPHFVFLRDLSGSAVQSPSLSFTREAEFAAVTAY